MVTLKHRNEDANYIKEEKMVPTVAVRWHSSVTLLPKQT